MPEKAFHPLALTELTVDHGINPRAGGINDAHADDIAEWLAANPKKDTAPAVVYRDPATGERRLSEGFHRHAGYGRAGRTHMPCEVRDGDRMAATLNAAASNKDHTVLKRTNGDKRLAVKLTIQAAPDWTDEKVATHCGVTHQFVGDVRAAVVLMEKLATVANSEADGEEKKGKKKKRGKKAKKTGQAEAAAKLLLENANQPNEDIAAKVGCTPKTVQVARKALEEAKQIEVVRFRKTSSAPAEQAGAKPDDEAGGAAPGRDDTAGAFVSSVETLCRDMDQIAARVKALKDSPLSYSMHWQGAADQVSAARKTLWVGRPAYPCPYCEFNGETKDDCTACRGTGRVKKDSRDRGLEAVGGAR